MTIKSNKDSDFKIIDQLSWENFYKESKSGPKFPKKITSFNRLIAHTQNFFVISGYGAFTPGYMIIITKEFIPSFSLIQKENMEELNTLINLLREFISNRYKRKVVTFEHGMCACMGGLDRAHLHLMSIPKNTYSGDLTKSINSTLENRKAGIKSILYKGFKLENKHDIESILQIMKNEKTENSEIKIEGKLLKLKDIQNLDPLKWPFIAHKHVLKGGHYVYFNNFMNEGSFLTTHNFQTQMGREIVFKNECNKNITFRNKMKNSESFSENWKWQNMVFKKNIIETISSAKKYLTPIKSKYKMIELEVI